jgi:hypothetical protein
VFLSVGNGQSDTLVLLPHSHSYLPLRSTGKGTGVVQSPCHVARSG